MNCEYLKFEVTASRDRPINLTGNHKARTAVQLKLERIDETTSKPRARNLTETVLTFGPLLKGYKSVGSTTDQDYEVKADHDRNFGENLLIGRYPRPCM